MHPEAHPFWDERPSIIRKPVPKPPPPKASPPPAAAATAAAATAAGVTATPGAPYYCAGQPHEFSEMDMAQTSVKAPESSRSRSSRSVAPGSPQPPDATEPNAPYYCAGQPHEFRAEMNGRGGRSRGDSASPMTLRALMAPHGDCSSSWYGSTGAPSPSRDAPASSMDAVRNDA